MVELVTETNDLAFVRYDGAHELTVYANREFYKLFNRTGKTKSL